MRKRISSAVGRNDALFGMAAIVGILGLAWCGDALAQERPVAVTANVAASTDYVFRGVSQTEEDPAISAGVDLTSGALYAGAWASNVSFVGDDDTSAEVDLYGGYRAEVGGWAVDVGGVAYLYTNQPDGADYDYVEAKLAISRAVGPATIGGAVFYSPDFFGAAEDEATYVEANAAFSPADRWTLSGALGRQFVSSDFDYTTWNVGAAYALTDTFAADVRYHDTDEHDFGQVYGARVVVSLKATF
jgi:uncharacterized protein (TIGR02001 family)